MLPNSFYSVTFDLYFRFFFFINYFNKKDTSYRENDSLILNLSFYPQLKGL